MNLNKIFLTGLFAVLLSFSAYCQTLPATGIKAIIAAIDTFNNRLPEEKLFLHLDKPYYTPGDTIWYKTYLLNSYLSSSPLSGLLYVELINDSSKVIKRQMLPVTYGVSWGDIVLKPGLYSGSYTIRAYTNWMHNFGEEQFFSRQLYIGPSGNRSWLVNKQVSADKGVIKMNLQFNDLGHDPVGLQEMRFRISDGKNTFIRSQGTTTSDGKLDVNFMLPEKANLKQLSLIAEDMQQIKGKDFHQTLIPVQLNRPENTDLQFMPEGGSLLAGLPVRVGFKAIGEDGKGVALSGKVYAQLTESGGHPADSGSSTEAIASFTSLFKGMGSFELTPRTGERYTAKVTMPDGTEKSYPLPEVKNSGVALQIQNPPDRDSLTLALQTTADMANIPGTYFLVGIVRGTVCYGANVSFKGKSIQKKIAKKLFPTGIVKFTLFAEGDRPLTERVIFIDHQDQLKISLTTSRESTPAGDSIAMNILVRDEMGKPLEGSFSLAVTDDSLVKADSPRSDNILSSMLLGTDLKGAIEDPGYYFVQDDPQKAEQLDNLLLTQGWTNYLQNSGNWQQVFGPKAVPEYEAELQLTVKGKAIDFFNSPKKQTQVNLLSKRPQLVLDTISNDQGRFMFSNFPQLDTIAFRIQALNKRNKSFNVKIDVDEFIPSGFTAPELIATPWYLNSDTTMIRYISKNAERKEEADKIRREKSIVLKEVVVKGRRPEDKILISIGEEEIRTARKGEKPLTLFQLYTQLIMVYNPQLLKNFKKLNIDRKGGPPADCPGPPGMSGASAAAFADGCMDSRVNGWLGAYTTDDIKKMAVSIGERSPGTGRSYITVVITSNSGDGPRMGETGVYFHRPMPMSWPHQFYSPRYTSKKDQPKDLRSTVFWEPNIVTDASGKAAVSFFASGSQAPYTLIMQGSDLNGKVGYLQKKLVLTKNSIVLSE